MGDSVVLTPNTIQILVYLSGCLRCSMCWVTRSWGRGRRWWEKSWSVVGLQSLRKDQMLSVSIARRLLKAHVMPGFQLRKSVCYKFTYTNIPDVKAFTHCCPHMAHSGNGLNISAIINNNLLQLMWVTNYKWAKILVKASVWLMLLSRRNWYIFSFVTKSPHPISCIIYTLYIYSLSKLQHCFETMGWSSLLQFHTVI